MKISYFYVDVSARYKVIKNDNWNGLITAGLRYLPILTETKFYSEETGNVYGKSTSNYVGPYVGFRFEMGK